MGKIKTIKRYYADWCNPCHAFEPTFKQASMEDKYKDVTFKSVNIEEDEGINDAENYNIKSIPTTIFLDSNDNVIGRAIGNMSLDNFEKEIDEANKK